MADTKIVVGVGTEGVPKTKTELRDIQKSGEKVIDTNEKLAKSNEKVSSSYKGTGGAIRNASFQLQDLLVQTQGGVSFTKSLAQQLPQLLSGFGLFGVVAGAAVAVLASVNDALDLFSSKGEKASKVLERYGKEIEKTIALGDDVAKFAKDFTGTAADGFIEYVNRYNKASESQRKEMERWLQLKLVVEQQKLFDLSAEAQGRNIDFAAGTGFEGQGGTQIDPKLERQLELDALIKKQMDSIDRLQAAIRGDFGAATAGATVYDTLNTSIQSRIDSLKAEAKYHGLSNAEKEKGTILAQLDAEATRNKIGLDRNSLKVKELLNAVDAKHNQEQQTKIKEFSREADLQDQLAKSEQKRLTMSKREYEKYIENIKLEAFILEKTVGWNEQNVTSLRKVLEEKLKVKQATDDLNESNKKAFGTGASKAIKAYMEDLADVAKSAENLFSNAFKGIEDAMVNAFMGGKLSFKAMIDSMMADIARLIIRQTIMRPLTESLMGGGSSALSGLLAQGFGYLTGNAATALSYGTNIGSQQTAMLAAQNAGMGVPLATGTNEVPYDGFQATLHKGEAVVPAAYNPAIGGVGGSSITYSPVINIDSRTDQADVRRLVQNAMQQSQLELVDKINRGQVKVRQ